MATDDGPTVVVVTGRNIAPGLLVSVLTADVSELVVDVELTLSYEVQGEGEPLLLVAGCGSPASPGRSAWPRTWWPPATG